MRVSDLRVAAPTHTPILHCHWYGCHYINPSHVEEFKFIFRSFVQNPFRTRSARYPAPSYHDICGIFLNTRLLRVFEGRTCCVCRPCRTLLLSSCHIEYSMAFRKVGSWGQGRNPVGYRLCGNESTGLLKKDPCNINQRSADLKVIIFLKKLPF